MVPTPSRPRPWSRALLVPLALVATLTLAACGSSTPGDGGGGPDPGPGPDPTDNTVESSLDVLGVDTSPTPRRGADGSELDDGAAPLGASAELGDPEEFTDESATHATAEL